MDAVNEFKRLLNFDLKKLQIDLNELKSLESINCHSEKLNNLLGGNVMDNISPDNINKCDQNKTDANLCEDISPGIDGNIVKTFDELIDIKLQDKAQKQLLQPSSERPPEKRPFLRRGEGVKRFSKGNSPKIDTNVAPPKLSSNSQKAKFDENRQNKIEKLIAIEPNLRTQSSDKCKTKRSDFVRKIIPISAKSSTEYGNRVNILKDPKRVFGCF